MAEDKVALAGARSSVEETAIVDQWQVHILRQDKTRIGLASRHCLFLPAFVKRSNFWETNLRRDEAWSKF